MSFRRAENVIEIDVEGEKLVYSQTQTAQLPLSDLGEHLVTAQEAREKEIIGRRWAEKTGNVFLTVRRMQHGAEPAEQMQRAINARGVS